MILVKTMSTPAAYDAYFKARELGIDATLSRISSAAIKFSANCNHTQWRELLDSAKLITEGRKCGIDVTLGNPIENMGVSDLIDYGNRLKNNIDQMYSNIQCIKSGISRDEETLHRVLELIRTKAQPPSRASAHTCGE